MKLEKVTLETVFFYIGILGTIAAAGAAAIVRQEGLQLTGRMLPCILYTWFHIPCPGCGGTRAVQYLLQGNILDSLRAHPLVLYGVICYLYFMGSYAYTTFFQKSRFYISSLRGLRILMMGSAVLLAVQWAIKLMFHTRL
jgi:hypothetical protein